jgi:hypothetical protein
VTEHGPYLVAFCLGLLTSVAGRALDLRWHATHDEFETASDPLQRARPTARSR